MTPRPKPRSDFPKIAHTFAPYSTVCSRCGASLLYVVGASECISDAEVKKRRQAALARRAMARLKALRR